MNYSQTKQLEDITLSSRVVVSDPCYDRSVWCRGELAITPGVYETKLYYSDEGQWGNRVAKLGVYRKGAGETVEEKKTEFSVGVDSGQAGIFCDTVYPQGETGKYSDKESFYGKVCNLTIGEGYEDRNERARAKREIEEIESGKWDNLYVEPGKSLLLERHKKRLEEPEVPYWQGGTYEEKGVVSSSGYGDGGYDCVVGTDKDGLTTYVEIEFISDSEEDDEDEEQVAHGGTL